MFLGTILALQVLGVITEQTLTTYWEMQGRLVLLHIMSRESVLGCTVKL